MNEEDGGRPAHCVEDVVITFQLDRRPSRTPDYATENRALATLAQEMAQHPGGVLQRVAELAMELCRADAAGISVLEPGGNRGIFRWHAASGAFASSLNGTVPPEASVTRPDRYHEWYNRRWYEYTGTTPAESAGEGWNTYFTLMTKSERGPGGGIV